MNNCPFCPPFLKENEIIIGSGLHPDGYNLGWNCGPVDTKMNHFQEKESATGLNK